MLKLKPCPFCGGKAKIIKCPCGEYKDLYVVGCHKNDSCFGNINHMTMIFISEETAAETWNRRANDA